MKRGKSREGGWWFKHHSGTSATKEWIFCATMQKQRNKETFSVPPKKMDASSWFIDCDEGQKKGVVKIYDPTSLLLLGQSWYDPNHYCYSTAS
jgi:hypothetical protein